MRMPTVLLGAAVLALGSFAAPPVQAAGKGCNMQSMPARHVSNGGDANCSPGRFAMLYATQVFPRYPTTPYYPMPNLAYAAMMPGYMPQAYVPPMQPMQSPFQFQQPVANTAPAPSLPPANVLPRPTGIANVANPVPAEAPVRMRYLELTVSGVQDAKDGERLAATLDKMDGSRGASVKRKGDGSAVVKVWYSEKNPLDEAAVLEAVAKLGFKAARL
jgi:hypothetical protein